MNASETTLQAPAPSSSTMSKSLRFLGPQSWLMWGVLAIMSGAVIHLYADSVLVLLQTWLEDDNYSHGPFIPLISLYLIWLTWKDVEAVERRGQWWGIPILGIGLCMFVVGEFAAMHAVVQFSLWIVIMGVLTCVIGLSGIRLLAFPLLYLLAAVPLPETLHGELSSRLQIWSSALGVGCLKLVGVMAYREGNVIDLGPIQLQVVEACSGLRYLFPLMSLAVLCAYLYRESFWKRVVLFLSSIPISILLNGFRIGAIGVLVESYGQSAAQGFSHFFEGWVFFVASLILLCGEMWVLARVGASPSRLPFGQLIGFPGGASGRMAAGSGDQSLDRPVAYGPLVAGVVLLILAALTAPAIVPREFPPAARQSLLEFPLQLGEWQGASSAMERQYLDALQLDDYVLADYMSAEQRPVNVYVAYYQSPKKGRSSHSPKWCIPGGGWEITSFEPRRMDNLAGMGAVKEINRLVIQKGGQKQIVYYWFKQRDRWITSEYAVKFFLFWDSLTRQRADGALVRLVSSMHAGETEAAVDQRLQAMAGLVTPKLSQYVPD